jgi:hypothetical protein
MAWLLIVSLVAAATLLPVNAAQARPSVQTWNLDTDFLAHPDMNPGPDSYGNAGVWNYMASKTLKRDGNYTLMPDFTSDTCGFEGLDGWMVPSGLPIAWINTTSSTITGCGTVNPIPPGRTLLNPGATQDGIVGWRSPITGTVHISGGVVSMDPHGGNGIKWFVDRGTRTLDKGSIPSGGKENFLKGLSATVKAGQFLYLILDSWNGSDGFDATRIRLTITG